MNKPLNIIVFASVLWFQLCGINKLANHDMAHAQLKCHCWCGYVDAWWPWNYPGVLTSGETHRSIWGGTIVCLRPDEPSPAMRMKDIQKQLNAIDCARGWIPWDDPVCLYKEE